MIIHTSAMKAIVFSIFFVIIGPLKLYANDLDTLTQYSDLLLISNNVYNPSSEGDAANLLPFGLPTNNGNVYTVKKVFEDPSSGFDAALYEDQNGNMVIAFRGTEFEKFSISPDIETDLKILQRNGPEDAQYTFVREVMDYVSSIDSSSVLITGHSLGGSLAQYASLYHGAKAVTFNTAPITASADALSYVTKPPGLYESGTSPFKNDPTNIVNVSSGNDPMTLLNLLIEEVEKGGDPFNLYVALRRTRDPYFTAPSSYVDRNKVRLLAIAFVAAAKKAYGLDGIQITSATVGDRIRLRATTGHSIFDLNEYYNDLQQEEYYKSLIDYQSLPEYLPEIPTPYAPQTPQIFFENDLIALAPSYDPITGLESHTWTAPGYDRANEDTIDIALNAAPTEPPVVTGNLYGFTTGGDYTPNGNSFSLVIGTQDGAVTANTDGSVDSLPLNNGQGSDVDIPTTNVMSSGYSYPSWGTSNTTNPRFYSPTGVTHTLSNTFWLYGSETSSTYLENRTGNASFAGDITGHFFDSSTTNSGNYYFAVTGELGFSVDFASDNVTGKGIFNVDYPGENFSEAFTIAGDFSTDNTSNFRSVSGNVGGLSYDVSSAANVVAGISGSDGEGYFLGSFFGPEAEEFGGAIGYFADGGAITGVVTAKPGTFTLPITETYTGFLAAKVENQQFLFATSGVTVDGDSATAPVEGSNTFQAAGLSPSITTNVAKGDYTYTSWGDWNGSGVTFNSQPIDQAKIVIGRLTDPSEIPSSGVRNFGGATNNSQVSGIGFNGEQIGGTIQLNADFGNGTIDGNFDFTADGSSWASGNMATTSITGNSYNSTLSVNGGGDGNIGGAFFGTNAQETAGNWNLANVPGAVGGADGVFRAKQ